MRLALLALALLAAPRAMANVCYVPAHKLHGIERQSWSAGDERLVLCSYYGSGMDSEFFVLSVGRGGTRLILDVPSDMAAKTVASPPKFTFTILTWRSEREPRVPLVRHDVTLSSTGVTMSSFFVLRGRPFSEARFRRYVREFGDESLSLERREALLYLIRDEGASRPKRALELLGNLDADAHLGEELSAVRGELQLARDLPHAP